MAVARLTLATLSSTWEDSARHARLFTGAMRGGEEASLFLLRSKALTGVVAPGRESGFLLVFAAFLIFLVYACTYTAWGPGKRVGP